MFIYCKSKETNNFLAFIVDSDLFHTRYSMLNEENANIKSNHSFLIIRNGYDDSNVIEQNSKRLRSREKTKYSYYLPNYDFSDRLVILEDDIYFIVKEEFFNAINFDDITTFDFFTQEKLFINWLDVSSLFLPRIDLISFKKNKKYYEFRLVPKVSLYYTDFCSLQFYLYTYFEELYFVKNDKVLYLGTTPFNKEKFYTFLDTKYRNNCMYYDNLIKQIIADHLKVTPNTTFVRAIKEELGLTNITINIDFVYDNVTLSKIELQDNTEYFYLKPARILLPL